MRITYKCDYAIKVILELALNKGKGVLSIQDLAKRIDASKKFLEQILVELKRAKFVQSVRGKKGGYALTKEPSQIKLAEVIHFIDGPTEPIACVADHYKGCSHINSCVLRGYWQQVDSAISNIIDNVDFEEISKQVAKQKGTLNYSI